MPGCIMMHARRVLGSFEMPSGIRYIIPGGVPGGMAVRNSGSPRGLCPGDAS